MQQRTRAKGQRQLVPDERHEDVQQYYWNWYLMAAAGLLLKALCHCHGRGREVQNSAWDSFWDRTEKALLLMLSFTNEAPSSNGRLSLILIRFLTENSVSFRVVPSSILVSVRTRSRVGQSLVSSSDCPSSCWSRSHPCLSC